MLQLRKPEERRRRGAERELDRAEAFFDLVLGLLVGHLLAVQIGMRPGVRADGVPGRGHLAENFRMVGGMLADREEQGLGALVGQRLEHRRRVERPRTVVKRQHHFLVGEEIELLEMLEAETGSAGGVDLDHAADAERIRIGAAGFLQTRGRRGLNRAGDLDRRLGTQALPPRTRSVRRSRRGRCSAKRRRGRGEQAQNHTPAITTAATTLASISPNALRILLLSTSCFAPGRGDRRAGPLMRRKS